MGVHDCGTAANPAGSFCGPNVAKAVTRPGGGQVSYRCDQNGNVLASSGAGADYPWRSVQYDASNRPLAITTGAYTDWFAYDSNGQRAYERLRPVDGSNNVLAETVIRRGPRGFEGEGTSVNVPDSNRTMRHELGDAIVILRTTDGAGGTLNNGRTVEVYYRHTDRLGSPLALSDSTRAFRQAGASATTRRAFDAFGQTRNADFSDRAQPPQVGSLGLAPATRNGFTGHEHLDTLGLIHMNGRVYDYRLGRFLSVDPIIQNPAHSQSLNPYSYIMNNPLAATDPSGYNSGWTPRDSACKGSTCAIKASAATLTGSHIKGVNTGTYVTLVNPSEKGLAELGGALANVGSGGYSTPSSNGADGVRSRSNVSGDIGKKADRSANISQDGRAEDGNQRKSAGDVQSPVPVSQEELQYIDNRDLPRFWGSRFKRADPWGREGASIWDRANPDLTSEDLAKGDLVMDRLVQFLAARDGIDVNQFGNQRAFAVLGLAQQYQGEIVEIGLAIARDHVDFLSRSGGVAPSLLQGAKSHHRVFESFGLPPGTYGGTPGGGGPDWWIRQQAIFTNDIAHYCDKCSP